MNQHPKDTLGVEIQADQHKEVIVYKTELAEFTIKSCNSEVTDSYDKSFCVISAYPSSEELDRPLEYDKGLQALERILERRAAFLWAMKMSTTAGEALGKNVDDLRSKVKGWAVAHRRIGMTFPVFLNLWNDAESTRVISA
ncbi:MAG: hypothetical protein Q9174_003455 [Haloplaca sp. 1 TL-2023]